MRLAVQLTREAQRPAVYTFARFSQATRLLCLCISFFWNGSEMKCCFSIILNCIQWLLTLPWVQFSILSLSVDSLWDRTEIFYRWENQNPEKSSDLLTLGFLDLDTTDILSWVVPCKGVEVSCTLWNVSSNSGLYSLDPSNKCPVRTMKNVSRHCQMFPGGQNRPKFGSTGLSNTES